MGQTGGIDLRPYRCDRCGHIHLTSRTKGKVLPGHSAHRAPARAGALEGRGGARSAALRPTPEHGSG